MKFETRKIAHVCRRDIFERWIQPRALFEFSAKALDTHTTPRELHSISALYSRSLSTAILEQSMFVRILRHCRELFPFYVIRKAQIFLRFLSVDRERAHTQYITFGVERICGDRQSLSLSFKFIEEAAEVELCSKVGLDYRQICSIVEKKTVESEVDHKFVLCVILLLLWTKIWEDCFRAVNQISSRNGRAHFFTAATDKTTRRKRFGVQTNQRRERESKNIFHVWLSIFQSATGVSKTNHSRSPHEFIIMLICIIQSLNWMKNTGRAKVADKERNCIEMDKTPFSANCDDGEIYHVDWIFFCASKPYSLACARACVSVRELECICEIVSLIHRKRNHSSFSHIISAIHSPHRSSIDRTLSIKIFFDLEVFRLTLDSF